MKLKTYTPFSIRINLMITYIINVDQHSVLNGLNLEDSAVNKYRLTS